MNKKVIAVISVVVVVIAGVGIYEIMTNEGYVNPGISILSFNSTSNAYLNGSFAVPVFYANISSSVTAEYKFTLGNVSETGSITGKQMVVFPNSLTVYSLASSAMSTTGIHSVMLSVLYNHFNLSKTLNIFTFPTEFIRASHYHIDTGKTDHFYFSPQGPYNFSWYSNGKYVGNANGTAVVFSSPGIYNISASETYGPYILKAPAFNVTVYNPPKATGIYYNNYTYYNFSDSSSFDVYMNESGGDIGSLGFCYSLYVNGSLYGNTTSFGNGEIYVFADGSGPFSVYFIISDQYYSSRSQTMEVV